MSGAKDKMSEDARTRPFVTIVGAGPVGAMLAVSLARRNQFNIRIVERRDDFRKRMDDFKGEGKVAQLESTTKRSINLALSHRGLAALDRIGLKEKVMERTITMKGRVIHMDEKTPLGFQPYGTGDQAILSVNRGEIACMLLDELSRLQEESECSVEIMFGHKVDCVTKQGSIRVIAPDGSTLEWDSETVFGCDGVFSPTRDNMRRMGAFDMHMEYCDCAYKELEIPPTAAGEFALPRPDGLHIWPRGDYMLIALPNPDKSFTATVFAPMKVFEEYENDTLNRFKRDFPTAYKVMPRFTEEWEENPTSQLCTLTVSPYHYKDRILLLGDSCHGTLPFYGQGMNCGFEDVLIFDDFMEQLGSDLSRVVPAYSTKRWPAANTLIPLSNTNYIEMRDKTARTSHVLRKKLDDFLHRILGSSWIPLYTMVAFTRIPYDVALRKAEWQDGVVDRAVKATSVAVLVACGTVTARYASELRQLGSTIFKALGM